MPSIGDFPIERFRLSTNLLITLCDKKYKSVWLDSSNCSNTKAVIYKGSFMDCVEYLYGFIPEIFKEYCKQYEIVIYTDYKRVGHLSLMQSLFDNGVLGAKEYTLLKKVFLTRGEIIHSTLWSSDEYYRKLNWIVDQLMYSDLQSLCSFVVGLCNKVNSSLVKDGEKKLKVEPMVNMGSSVRASNSWSR